MSSKNRTHTLSSRSQRYPLIVASLLLTACGAKAQSDSPADLSTSTTGGTAGANGSVTKPSGGNMAIATTAIGGLFATSTGGIASTASSSALQGGSAGNSSIGSGSSSNVDASAACDQTPFWDAVTRIYGGVLSFCWVVGDDAGGTWGTILIDSQGQVVDITGLPETYRQKWLDSLAGQTWPCLANQTYQYSCSIAA
jgi:hypothetical protein